jgi:hypothetical protein
MLLIKTRILATTMASNDKRRIETSKPTSLSHYVLSMDNILTTSPKYMTSKG